MQNRMRRLAGILLLAMPDVAMREEELLNILQESEATSHRCNSVEIKALLQTDARHHAPSYASFQALHLHCEGLNISPSEVGSHKL